ncbi:polysaccharide biosynthesis protein [Blastomonas fulva]|uniref:polysaccharide biosynthesis protein n=1 Tax=Blastomonas fulva TaxID=1550728 RepID=UPI003F6F6EF3
MISPRIYAFADAVLKLDRSYKRLLVILTDAVLCVCAVQVSFLMRIGEWALFDRASHIVTLIALALWAPIYTYTGTYRTIFRFAGVGTMAALMRTTMAFATPIIVLFMIWTIPGVPRTLGLILPIIFFAFLCLSRIVARYMIIDVLTQRHFAGEPRRVLVYGAGSSGRQLVSSLKHEPGMQVTGFVDDDHRLKGQTLDDYMIYKPSELPQLIERYKLTDIMLAMPSNTKAKNRDIVASLEKYGLHVRTLPGISELVKGRITSQDLREINVEDLLGRDCVPASIHLMGKTIVGKTVMVTGAGGSIGSELCRKIVMLQPRVLVLVEMTEYALYAIEQELTELLARNPSDMQVRIVAELANVSNPDLVERMVERWKPHTIFHAAAYKHVPLVEENPFGGISNNVFGTLNVALAAERKKVSHFILVSTDKAVRPTNIMGATKRVCEQILQARAALKTGTCFSMVRFGNVLGSSGSVVPRFEKQIRNGGPVTLTHRDVVRYFMTIPEAAELVIQAGAMANGGEVFVLDMGSPVRIIDLASRMVRLAGLTVQDAQNPEGDIEIREVGLRPGEKLYEELLIGDNAMPTEHSRIMRANEDFIPWDELTVALAQMQDTINGGRREEALAILRRLVPEYSPQKHEPVLISS